MTFSNIRFSHLMAGGASVSALAAIVVIGALNTGQHKIAVPEPITAKEENRLDAKREADQARSDDSQAFKDKRPNANLRQAEPAPVAELAQDVAAPAGERETISGHSGATAQPPSVMARKQRSYRPSIAESTRNRVGSLQSAAAPLRPSAVTSGPRPDAMPQPQYRDQGRDKFTKITANPVKVAAEEPVSTFSIDVDTASYSFMRAALNRGVLPHKDSVRVEELINYFPYDYKPPATREVPFNADVTMMASPWKTGNKLLHVAIKGYQLPKTEKPRSNLVFLIDTSGSMNAPNKLPLLRNSFKLLLGSLDPEDTVAIVTYAGSAGTVLAPTKVKEQAKIVAALERLSSGGSTAGAEGIRQAYRLAEQGFDKKGVNRVILATDGDFNVGITNQAELKSYIERKRKSGVMLSVLGFGRGNYNDALMQTLAQNGNGTAAYIDSLSEARKVLVEEAGSTLFNIARDVKIQIEFNPNRVSEYRLIGYETRMLAREDFNNDKIDAGDIGAGHAVTAIYEITPKGSPARLVEPLRYQKAAKKPSPASGSEFAFLKIRYKLPGESASKLITRPVTEADDAGALSAAPREARFAAAVAGFGQLLRGGRHTGAYSHDDVIALAQGAKGEDKFGYRAEFINLVRLAKSAAALSPLKE